MREIFMPVIGGMEIKMGVFFDIYNVRKPGKGVEKKEYTPRFQLYFELVWRKMWMFCKTNLLYLTSCVIVLILIWFGYSAVSQGTLATLKGVMFLTVCTIYLSICLLFEIYTTSCYYYYCSEHSYTYLLVNMCKRSPRV